MRIKAWTLKNSKGHLYFNGLGRTKKDALGKLFICAINSDLCSHPDKHKEFKAVKVIVEIVEQTEDGLIIEK